MNVGRGTSLRREVALPEGLKMRDTGRELVVTRRWFSAKAFFFVFFLIIWFGFLGFWYSKALSGEGSPSMMALLFPLGHVAVGLGLGYFTLATFMNTTVITVGIGTMTVRHGPLPWRGNRDVRVSDVGQLYVREKVTRNNNSTSVTYQVVMETGGRSVAILKGLPEREQGVFVEQQIEKRIGIVDESNLHAAV